VLLLHSFKSSVALKAFKEERLDLKNKIDPDLEFIKYRTTPVNSEEIRDIVVINGQPFYRSTGNNSKLSAVWFPFICIKGNQEAIKKENISALIQADQLGSRFIKALLDSQLSDKYIIKYETKFKEAYNPLINQWLASEGSSLQKSPIAQLLNRCVTLECLALSCSLGGGIWDDSNYNSLIKEKFFGDNNPVRIKLKETAVFNTEVPNKVNEWLVKSGAFHVSELFHFDEPLADQTNDVRATTNTAEVQIQAFRKIYNALYEGQSSLFKSKADHNELTIEKIRSHIDKKPNSRSAEAWKLAQIHYENTSATNLDLFKSIHKYSFKHSSTFFSLFRQSINFPEGYSSNMEDKIEQARDDSRTGKISMALGL
jgi:hypothetical protein